MATNNNYQLLIEKLDEFIRKFYVNQLIRGGLYSIALILALFLGLNFLEHEFYFHSGIRATLFWSFVGISGAALTFWALLPLIHYFKLGLVISHEQAAKIIGQHFADVKDKLLNVLQLRQQADGASHKELILASINQKSERIKLVPFKKAIDLSQNRKYLRYALPPLLLLFILLFAAPSLIKDSTARLIKYNKEFEKPAPFHFIIGEENLSVIQFGDFPLKVKVEGEVMPDEVFIDVDNYQYRLTKLEKGVFAYRFNNVQKDTEFKLFSSGIESKEYKLAVLKKPGILGFEVKLNYPNYTGRKDEALASIGDLVVPAGTTIDWVFNSQNTDAISIKFSNKKEIVQTKRFSDELFTYKKRALHDESYKLYISNAELPNADSISYAISVIPDLYPTIKAEKFQDSLDNKLLYFIGEASDDYGLLSLSFNYRINKEDGTQGELQTLKMQKPDARTIQYTHSWDLNELELPPGTEVTYYFEVYDNDAINGSKSARTNLMVFAMPTVEEYEAMEDENEEEIKFNLKKSLEESQKIQKDMKKLREKLLQEKEVDWQTRKELEKLLERQKELRKQIEQAKQTYEENLKNQQEFTQTDERIVEKQEQLQKLFDETKSEEMEQLMKQIEELMEKLEKEGALDMMKDMEFSDEELEMELDRMLELFKQLEMEYEMQQAIDKLEQLAEEQENLSEETEKTAEEQPTENEDPQSEEKQQKQEDLQQKQGDINKKFDDIDKQMDELEKKNQEMENPKDLGEQDEQMEDIQQDLNDSQQQLQQNQNKKASQKQKNAAEKMRKMASNMQMQMQSQQMEQMQEDMQALRQLLENLVGLSFGQEDLMKAFHNTTINTPRYTDLVERQFKLQDDFKLVEDSLQALSKRVFQIESYVTEKVSDIKSNMRQSLKELEERRKPQASEHQQRSMKNLNDLALMLSEVMDQMQQQMSGMMAGNQMCNHPGGNGKPGNVPSDKMSKGQEKLNEQMKRMKESLEKGMGGSSEEFAKMAARQAALRQALREKEKQLQEQGQGSKELEEMIEQMNKIETDLVNKTLTNEMLKRQQEILTRLLEHEKAEREREYENKRKSETAREQKRKIPPSLEEYVKKRAAEIEQYKTVSPALRPYYKSLVEEYFNSLKEK